MDGVAPEEAQEVTVAGQHSGVGCSSGVCCHKAVRLPIRLAALAATLAEDLRKGDNAAHTGHHSTGVQIGEGGGGPP